MPEFINSFSKNMAPYFEAPYTTEERKQMLGERLKQIRQEHRLTQKEVSNLIGITAQTYNGYEKGKYEPSAETLVRLAYLYQTTVDYLVAKNSDPRNPDAELKDELATYDPEKMDNFDLRLSLLEEEIREIRKRRAEEK